MLLLPNCCVCVCAAGAGALAAAAATASSVEELRALMTVASDAAKAGLEAEVSVATLSACVINICPFIVWLC